MLVNKERKSFLIRALIFILALAFLYLPILTLIVYSFNDSRMVTVWTEASLRWYYELFNDEAIIKAVSISIIVALMTATASVIIGTLAAFVMTRVRAFRGESLFVLLMTAPMVLPEVITGLALLLVFVTLGSEIPIFANRGIWAIWIAHVTFCSAYTTVVIRSRFRELDISIEEAAKDLGAGPIKVFFAIILPALMPSEVAAFLLAFTMSMDDLVITSFIAGPDSTTLPMLIFSSVRRGLSPEINALATIIVLVVSVGTFFAWLSMINKEKRKRADAAKAAKAAAEEQNLQYHATNGVENTFKISPEEMAVLKAQAKAIQEGRDPNSITLETIVAENRASAQTAQSVVKIVDSTIKALTQDQENQEQSDLPKEQQEFVNQVVAETKTQVQKEQEQQKIVTHTPVNLTNKDEFKDLQGLYTVEHKEQNVSQQEQINVIAQSLNTIANQGNIVNDLSDEELDSTQVPKAMGKVNNANVDLQSPNEPYNTAYSLAEAKEKKLHEDEKISALTTAVAQAVKNPSSLDTTNHELNNAHEKNEDKLRRKQIGESAISVTSQQREVSVQIASAGKAKVVDNIPTNLESPELKPKDAETKASAGAKPTIGGAKKQLKNVLNLVGITSAENNGQDKIVKTTTSSLEDAKAKKAANQEVLAKVHESAQTTQDSELKSSEVVSSKVPSIVPTKEATTISSLASAKAKAKAKTTDELTSAKAVTKANTDKAMNETMTAKVVDQTKE